MSDLNDLLSDEQPAAEVIEQPEPEQEAQEAEATPAESEAEPEVAEEATEQEQPKSVPHERFHAELQRRKELEAELEKMRSSEAKPKAAPDLSHLFVQGEDDKLPDPVDDPQGYNQAIESRFNQRLARERFSTSETFARQVHGAEVVDAAMATFAEASKQNALLRQAAESSPNPVGEIVNWHKQQQFWARVQEAGGPEAYEKALQEAAAQSAPVQPAEQEKPAAVMPTDMATARSAAPRNGGFQPASLDKLLG
jgi:hypothetical protein